MHGHRLPVFPQVSSFGAKQASRAGLSLGPLNRLLSHHSGPSWLLRPHTWERLQLLCPHSHPPTVCHGDSVFRRDSGLSASHVSLWLAGSQPQPPLTWAFLEPPPWSFPTAARSNLLHHRSEEVHSSAQNPSMVPHHTPSQMQSPRHGRAPP